MTDVRRLISWSVIGTGISSITVQLVVIREFLAQFNGNEMTISVAMFSWLILTGMGSYAARFVRASSIRPYALLALLAALWPLPQLIMIRHFRETVFIHGASPGFYHIFIFILAIIALYCLLSGLILPLSLTVLRSNGYPSTSGDIYITDSIGDIAGGIIFSFILVYLATPCQAIAVTSSLAILTALALLYVSGSRWTMAGALLLVTGFYTIALNHGLEVLSLSGQYGEIVKYLESPYGRVVVTREGSQHTFWESGMPLYSDENIMESEERIHYPLSQRREIGAVLIISGGLGETLDEAEKHGPSHIDYLELDPWLTGAARDMGILKDRPNLDIINADARGFIKGSERRYDAIIVNLPDPDTFQINRFYTAEFFALAKEALNDGGILSFGLEYSENFISGIRRKKLSTMYNTAASVFKNVEIIPGARAYFLCSDGEIAPDIPGLLKEKGVSTAYIEGFYQGNVTADRIERLRAAIDRGESVNRDFRPGMVRVMFGEWFSQYDTSPWLFICILAGICIVYMFFIRREEYILFSTGLTVMGTEMLIIFTFQVIYGYIYLRIGVVVTAFLLGLLPGAILGRSCPGRSGLMASEIAIIMFLLIFMAWGLFFRKEIPHAWFFIYCFLFALLGGFQFPVITGIMGEDSRPIAGCLAADFTGAAVGTILVGAFLIPSIGINASIALLILVKISSCLTLIPRWGRKRG